ncbi:ArdC family protein [Azospirillum sp. Marseille-Q6669]
MPDASRSVRSSGDRTSLYAEITTRIIAELEAGRLPWVQPWGGTGTASLGLPRNASSGRAYSGINVLILWGAVFAGGFSGQTWLTYRQAQALGGNVRKGERGTTVVYADRFIPDRERLRAREEGDTAQPIPFLKRFSVFNVDQCQGLPEDIAPVPPPIPDGLILPRAEALIRASGVDVRIGGAQAFYHLQHDYVQVPSPQSFFEPVNWHRTALHELGHSTGHPSRLGRDLSGAFGSRKYAVEELVAEIASAFLCAALGIVPTVRHADYIGAWLDVLRNDDHAIVRAASQASKAADYLLGLLPDDAPVAGAAREAA